MDNYKLDEVKTIIDKNLMTPQVLENILKNSTKRIELYNDFEAVEILRFLSDEKLIPDNTKEEIDRYLANYDNYSIEVAKKNKKDMSKTIRIIMLYIVILLLAIIYLALHFKK